MAAKAAHRLGGADVWGEPPAVNYPEDHKWFCTSPCGGVSVTSCGKAWHVWIFAWMMPQPFRDEVQAVMMLQKLTRPKPIRPDLQALVDAGKLGTVYGPNEFI